MHKVDTSVQARNQAPLRKCLRGHQKQSICGQRRGRDFLVGPCQVSSIVLSHHGVEDFELIRLSSHKEVMEMQCDLLMSNSRDTNTIKLVKGNIGHIFDGSLPHCAGSLKLGLRKAFDLKKKERQPPGVKLRCSYSGCSWYINHVSFSAVQPNCCCSMCGRWMQCVGCGYSRTSNYASCQSCGKRFI